MSKQDIDQAERTDDAPAITLEGLIQQQGVAPVISLDELSDLWPADDDPDQFMRYVLGERAERRRLQTAREESQ